MSTRAQANLPAVAVALLVLTATLGLVLAAADGSVGGARREPVERHAAAALSERLVSPDGPVAARPNVLDADAVATLTPAALRRAVPVARGRAVRLALDDRVVLDAGDTAGGTTVRRLVLVERRAATQLTPVLRPRSGRRVALPRRTPRVRLHIDPPDGTVVRAVRADGRVVLLNGSGLSGTFVVDVSRFETVDLRFDAAGPLPRGSVTVTYFPATTTKAVLAVTVDG